MRFRAVALLLVLPAAFAFALWAGIGLDPAEIGDGLSAAHRIFFELRIPRAVFVFFAGALLASVGAVYQILFHNALAEPYVLGISSAATLGIALAEMVFGVAAQSALSQAIGISFAVAVTGALLALSYSHRGRETERIALFGLGVNFVLSSLLFLLLSYQAQTVGGGSLRWLFGQVPWLNTAQALRFAAGAIVGMGLLLAGGRALDALAFGDGVARSLGYHALRVRFFFLAVTSLLVAWLVSFTGSIGFVGLVVPHAVRLVFHPSTTRKLLLYTVPLGGAFLLVSDGISRALLPPMEFPVGIVTTLIGGPLFLVLLWKR